MKIKRLLSLLMVTVWMLSLCLMPVLAEEEDTGNLTVTKGCHSIDAAIPFLGGEQAVMNARSVFMLETNSQTLMYAWNPDLPMYPASLTKLMTALLVFEKGNLQDTVTVQETALKSIDVYSLSVKLSPGENMSVENLLYCMLVYSANDAASVLAEYISGSEANFVSLMNSRAAELGCTNTTFVNPHGLHSKSQVTTARDVSRILLELLKYDTFRTMFGTVKHIVPATNKYPKERNLTSSNLMMDKTLDYYDERVKGGRVGETAEGERCLATVSQSGNMEIITIVMGSRYSYDTDGETILTIGGFYETKDLLDKAYDGYARRQIVSENQIMVQKKVSNGDCDLFVAVRDSFSTVLPSGITKDQLSFQYTDANDGIQAPIVKGQAMGTLQVWYDGMCIAQTELYAMNDVPVAFSKAGEWKEPEADGYVMAFVWIAIGVAALLSAGVFILIKVIKRSKDKLVDVEKYERRHRK